MRFPDVDYLRWAKYHPPARVNLARSGVEPCPASVLGLTRRDLVVTLPVTDGYAPLRRAIARRYGVDPDQVFTVSGGTSFANFFACAAALDGCADSTEAIVERPTYEPLLRIPEALGCRTNRLDRSLDNDFAVDLARFERLMTPRTRLAVVSNLHNPSGARLSLATLRKMAAMLRPTGYLVVDEVYLECLFGSRPESCVHAGANVVVTNSLTKAYGLDGLRAGWMLGPRDLVERAWRIQDLLANNGVAAGERMSVAAFKRLPLLRRRAHAALDRNLGRLRAFFERERRLEAFVPEGGNVVFPRLPTGVDGDAFAAHLQEGYSTLVVPGRFFEAPEHFRISFGMQPAILERGLANISRALDDIGGRKGLRYKRAAAGPREADHAIGVGQHRK
jgi:aspartate/methionine/tyrosine aminotransferase